MATLTIRNLPDEVRDRLRVRAAQNGRSMEAEAREALAQVFNRPTKEESLAAIERMQEWVCSLPAYDPNASMADELIEERRAEAAREQAEIEGWLKARK